MELTLTTTRTSASHDFSISRLEYVDLADLLEGSAHAAWVDIGCVSTVDRG